MKSVYSIIKSRYVTEKTSVLNALQTSESNRCTRKCNTPKYAFLVDKNANKREIAKAVESIYQKENIQVKAVNTINVKSKPKTMRGRRGRTSSFKKAIVTLSEGDSLDDEV